MGMLNLRGLRALEIVLERCFAAAAAELPPLHHGTPRQLYNGSEMPRFTVCCSE